MWSRFWRVSLWFVAASLLGIALGVLGCLLLAAIRSSTTTEFWRYLIATMCVLVMFAVFAWALYWAWISIHK